VSAPKSLQDTSDLIAGLRALGFRIDEARRAVVATASASHETLEVRMKAALRYLCPRAGVTSIAT
jgi:Holliday junction resolvasome RuvABC DNA-binding subunit